MLLHVMKMSKTVKIPEATTFSSLCVTHVMQLQPGNGVSCFQSSLWMAAISRLFHCSIRLFSSYTRVVGWTGRRKITTCSIFQTCSIGLRSCEYARQCKRTMASCWRYSSTTLAQWGRALSSIRMDWVRLHQHTVWRRLPGYHPCSINRSSCPLSRCVGLFVHLCW